MLEKFKWRIGNAPTEAEWNRMVANEAGARPWVVYGLLVAAAAVGVWQASEQLDQQRRGLLDSQHDAMEMMSLGIESPYHAGVDHVRLAVSRLRSQGLVDGDFALPPPGGGRAPHPRLAELEQLFRDPSLYASSLLPRAGMINAEGELLAGVLPPGVSAATLRAEFPTLPKPTADRPLTWLASPRYDAEARHWVNDAILLYGDKSGARLGGFVFQLDQRRLAPWISPDDRGAPGRHSRAFIIHAKTGLVCTSDSGAALRRDLPGPGDLPVIPGYAEALANGVRDRNGVIVFRIPSTGGMPPFLCRLESGRFSLGYHVLVQSDEDVLLAPWRMSRMRVAGAGAALLILASFSVYFDARRRRLRGELTVMRAELAVRRRQEEEMVRLNAELEARVSSRTAELSAVNTELAEANRELDAYARTVTHDLRAPIRSIRSYADMLAEDHAEALSPEVRALLDKIRARSRRMNELVEEIFRLARSSHSKPRRELVDLSAMANDVLTSLREGDPGRRAVIRVAPGCVANADPALTRIVLENLLGNAWKYSARRTETVVDFGCETVDGVSMFYVRDKGAGFDPAQSAKLFKPFSRLHRNDEFEGTGVGLATVARIVRIHGGEIRADGRPDEGATFRFTLVAMDGEVAG